MRLSNYFLPTLRDNPKDAQIVSHRYMLRAGMIQQASAGIYSWLPMGVRVLKKIEQIVREEQNNAGAQEILMPTIQSADLWKESGRYEDYGKELLRITDRHERDMLYGPTNEEQITEIFRSHVKSYRTLPLSLYHIQWKFRDEVRPRFGVMRGREFLMKDAYSFDLNYDDAIKSYNKMFIAYLKTYARMGLKVIPMAADSGPIGGDMSHEFIILADTGESEVFYQKNWFEVNKLDENVDIEGDLQPLVDSYLSCYAATDEKHDLDNCSLAAEDLVATRGIEVGHIFYFGTKYSDALRARVAGKDGNESSVHMGSYGVGVSRLVGAIIEANHDEKGIVWPESVTPFRVGLVNIKIDDRECLEASENFYTKLQLAGVDVLYDDRDERTGAKLANMDLIGLPWQIIVGPRGLKAGVVEIKNRRTGVLEECSIDQVMTKFRD
ncbi:proline--tRNA ligase [Rhodospirillaceae bacterium]|nr:proline--tRNA ligase [Rhodospirillaceae bacterium]MBT7731893.1 proline--tRNA ligase [Rhodospirillaceae bacterium]MDC1442691.1 proline--tRNA ligase [Rhodospirillaceae bacterium]MDG1274913.1 proline--tRNA ligase [Alphaproteobacteria bacterium]